MDEIATTLNVLGTWEDIADEHSWTVLEWFEIGGAPNSVSFTSTDICITVIKDDGRIEFADFPLSDWLDFVDQLDE